MFTDSKKWTFSFCNRYGVKKVWVKPGERPKLRTTKNK